MPKRLDVHFSDTDQTSDTIEACASQPQRPITRTTRFKSVNGRKSQPLSASFRSCDVELSEESYIIQALHVSRSLVVTWSVRAGVKAVW